MDADTYRAPPSNVEAEHALLGAILINNRAWEQVSDFLRPEHFADPAHSRIFEAIGRQIEHGHEANPMTLEYYFKDDPVLEDLGGHAYLARLAASAVTVINARDYGHAIYEHYLRREIIAIGEDMVNDAYAARIDDAPMTQIERVERRLYEVATEGGYDQDLLPISTFAGRAIEEIGLARENQGVTGAPSGLYDLDRLLGGFHNTDLIILAARPSMGKTSLAANICFHVAQHVGPPAMFSLEMSGEQLTSREIATRTGISSHQLRSGYTTIDQLYRAQTVTQDISALPFFLDDTPNLTVDRLRARARRAKRRHDIRMVVVDYLQLMSAKAENRTQELAIITRGLKGIAKELDVPVIALSQLSRQVEARDDKRPQLADLRESGCLTGDTLVYLSATGDWQRIDSLPAKPFAVASENSGKIVSTSALKAFPSGTKEVFEMTTGSGRRIKATASHKFLTREGWKPLGALTEKEKIAVPVLLPGPSVATIPETQVALLGHLIGNGCVLARHTVQYTTADIDLAIEVSDLARAVFPGRLSPRICHEGRKGSPPSWIQVYLPSARPLGRGRHNPIMEWFTNLGIADRRAHEKRVPEIIFQQGTEGISTFLRHLWSTDGCICRRKRPTRGQGLHYRDKPRDLLLIVYSTSSPGLAEDVHNLLLRLGIKSHVRCVDQGSKGLPNFTVTICGLTGKRRFLADIGIAGSRKQALALNAQLLLDECGESTTYDGDIYWDAVASIQSCGTEKVYDITVPSHHNFIANGIVVHNSIEQDADVVMFIYREEYYLQREEPRQRATETADKFNERHTTWELRMEKAANVAEVIIAKQRHGPIGSVSLRFDPVTTKFSNLDQTEWVDG